MLNQPEPKAAPVEPPARLSALVTPICTPVRSRATCVATRRSRGVEPAAVNHRGKASRQANRSPSEPGETKQAALKNSNGQDHHHRADSYRGGGAGANT